MSKGVPGYPTDKVGEKSSEVLSDSWPLPVHLAGCMPQRASLDSGVLAGSHCFFMMLMILAPGEDIVP